MRIFRLRLKAAGPTPVEPRSESSDQIHQDAKPSSKIEGSGVPDASSSSRHLHFVRTLLEATKDGFLKWRMIDENCLATEGLRAGIVRLRQEDFDLDPSLELADGEGTIVDVMTGDDLSDDLAAALRDLMACAEGRIRKSETALDAILEELAKLQHAR